MELKKSKDANLEKRKFSWLALGACSVLSMLLVSFVVTSYDLAEVKKEKKVQKVEELEEEIVAASTPPPPTTAVLEIVEDDEEIIELNLDLDLDEDEEIEDVNYEEPEEEVYEAPIMTRAERMPVFPGDCDGIANADEQAKCTEAAIINFVQSNAAYPDIAKENGFQGKVFLTFIVDDNGKVGNVEILKGIHKSLDDSATKAVLKLPKFKPATQRGKPVKLKYTIPVNFKLR